MTQKTVIFQIIRTHLLARKRQTTIASLGVTFGIGFYIAMVAFMTGVNNLLEDLMLSATPHIRIFNDVKIDSLSLAERYFNVNSLAVLRNPKPLDKPHNIKDAPEILHIIQNNSEIYGASPRVTSQVYYLYGVTEIPGSILGVDLLQEEKLFGLQSKITVGELDKVFAVENGVMMGGGLAAKLNVSVGDRVNITLPNGTRTQLNVVAIFRMGIALVDNAQCYATLRTVQKLLRKDARYITDINIKLYNLDRAKSLAAEFAREFGFSAEDWETANATILVSFTMRNIITYAVAVSMLIVAGFGIYNIMTMMMYEKMKDIAILKAMGFDSRDISQIFLGQAIILGIIGGIAGLVFGFAMSFAISKVPYHNDFLPGMDHLPVNFTVFYYYIAFAFALLSAGVAGIFPARRAAKVDPVAIIRG